MSENNKPKSSERSPFKFYKGVVFDNNDPLRRGRVQVFIEGVHDGLSDLSDTVKSYSLPWAEVVQGTFLGLSGGTGSFSVLQKNTSVWIVLDQGDVQVPIVVGVMTSGKEGRTGIFDKELAYEGANQHPDNPMDSIPNHADKDYRSPLANTDKVNNVYESKYLSTSVIKTPGGHLIEFDDTDNTKAIRITHGSGMSCIILQPDGSIDITGTSMRFNAVEDIFFKAGRNVMFDVGKDGDSSSATGNSGIFTVKCERDMHVQSNKDITMSAKKNAYLQTEENEIIIQANKGSITQSAQQGVISIGAKDNINIESKANILTTAKEKIVAQSEKGAVVLDQVGAMVSSKEGPVTLYGNEIRVAGDAQFSKGIHATEIIQSNVPMLAPDFITATVTGSIPQVMSAMNESVNDENENIKQYTERNIDEINAEARYIQKIKDTDTKKKAYDGLVKKYNDFTYILKKKSIPIKKEILNAYIANKKEVFGSVDPNEVQFLTESITSPVSITPRTPNGTSKTLFDNSNKTCTCNWLDPSNWFNIELPQFPTWDDFKNMFEWKGIKWPNWDELLPNLPKISIQAIIKAVMYIAMMPVIKLLSMIRSMIMQALAPIISILNQIKSIINMIPPKITIGFDFSNIIPTPLFNFPKFPDNFNVPNICCSVNQCNCQDCHDKISEFLNNMAEKADKVFSSNQKSDTKTNNDTKSSPNGTSK